MEGYLGKERRSSQEQQIGYIAGKLESVQGELSDFKSEIKDTVNNHHTNVESRLGKIEELVHVNSVTITEIARNVEIQTNTYKYLWITIKSIAAALFLAITMKFGDIINLFK